MHRRNHWKTYTLVALLLAAVSAFTVEGEWELDGSSGVETNGEAVTLSISDVVFRNQSILQKLSFKGCE